MVTDKITKEKLYLPVLLKIKYNLYNDIIISVLVNFNTYSIYFIILVFCIYILDVCDNMTV